MKRLLIALAISFVAAGAFAQVADRDVLVTPDGTVYTVEQQTPSDSSGVAAIDVLAAHDSRTARRSAARARPGVGVAGLPLRRQLSRTTPRRRLSLFSGFTCRTGCRANSFSPRIATASGSRQSDRQSGYTDHSESAPRHHAPRFPASERWHLRRRTRADPSRSLVG